jgi:SAM-dependent methyltransferase
MTLPFAPDLAKPELVALLASEPFEYQKMPLPFGLSTKGQDRSDTASLVLPDQLAGQSVVDIGCCYGYFCYEAMKRGASRAVGVELDPDRFRHATKLQRAYRDKVELVNADFQTVLGREQFDYVLFLNVIHHLTEPAAALKIVAKATRVRCAIEFPTFTDKRFRKTLPPLIPRLLNRLPLTGVALLDPMDQTYVFSREGMRRMLTAHEPLFARVEFVPSPIEGRLIAICYK